MTPMVNFADASWTPDRAAVSTPGVNQIRNLLPTADGCRSIPDLLPYKLEALSAECRGAQRFRTQSGLNELFAGTKNDLYRAVGETWDPVTGVAYAVPIDGKWDLELYGDRVLATNGFDPVQSMVIGIDTDFSVLDAHASLAHSMMTFREFTVLGNIVGQGNNAQPIGTQEGGVHWSGIGQPDYWPTVGDQLAIDVQSDFQALEGDGGPVRDLVPAGEWALVLRERQTWRMDYIGQPAIFAFRKLDHHRGAILPNTAIAMGGLVYYFSEEGFLACNGASIQAIGHEKVDRTVLTSIDWGRANAHSSVAHEANWRSIVWAFPATTGGSLIVGYHYEQAKWWTMNKTVEWIVTVFPTGDSMDSAPEATMQTDTDSPTGLGDIEMDTLGRVEGENEIMGAFQTDHKLALFNNTTWQGGVLETGDTELPDARRGMVRWVRPVFRGTGSIAARVGVRMNPADPVVWKTTAPLNSVGVLPTRASGRYHRAEITTSGQIVNLQGLDFAVQPGGSR